MSYLVLARKWRPQTFEQILGQDSITRTLKNAIVKKRMAHALLFSGPRGVGKTTMARVLSKALNCQSYEEATTSPCGKCSACVQIAQSSAVDVLEIDGASNTGVDNIRDLRETVRYLPASLRTKIYIIDEVHMLSKGAFNALLKTLEEPPAHVMFIFATTEPHKVPQTILSRCQRYDFHRVGAQTIFEHLANICQAEDIKLPEGALRVVASEADGSVRDGLSLLDQVTSFGHEELSEDDVLRILGVVDRSLIWSIGRSVLDGDASGVLSALAGADEAGHDVKQLAKELIRWFRDLVVVKISREPERLMEVSGNELEEFQAMAEGTTLETAERLFDQLSRLDEELGRSGQPRLLLEMTLVRMAVTPPMAPVAEVIARLEELEAALREASQEQGSGGAAIEHAPLFKGEPEKAYEEDTGEGAAQSWEDLMDFVEKHDGKLFTLLSAGTFRNRSGREWRLAFDPGSFHMEKLKEQENAKKLQEFMVECFGEGHRLVITEDIALSRPAEKASPYKQEEEKRKEAMDDPVVKGILDKLGGELEDVKTK